jgi:hypothetical protein
VNAHRNRRSEWGGQVDPPQGLPGSHSQNLGRGPDLRQTLRRTTGTHRLRAPAGECRLGLSRECP